MMKTIKQILVPIAAFLILGMVLFMINQIASIYLLVASFDPLAAKVTLIIMVLLLVALVSWPIWLIAKLPQPLSVPKSEKELKAYQKKLIARLSSNKVLKEKGKIPKTVADLDESLSTLNVACNKIISDTAKAENCYSKSLNRSNHKSNFVVC